MTPLNGILSILTLPVIFQPGSKEAHFYYMEYLKNTVDKQQPEKEAITKALKLTRDKFYPER